MRITLDIASDVLQAVNERARREGKTAGEMISELARSALTAPRTAVGRRSGRSVHGFTPFPKRGEVVTNERIAKLREDDAY